MRAVDVVRRVAPKARPEYIEAFERGDELLRAAGVTTPLRLAHFLAQVLHESGGLRITQENMSYRAQRIMEIFGQGRHSAAVTASEAEALAGNPFALAERVYGTGNPRKARELGNLNAGDGFRYRGGGIMQTTGRANYRRMGARCGVDFERHPELVYSAEHALKPALAEWTEGMLNEKADADDILAITRRINGGCNGLADREHWFRKVRPLIDSVDVETVKPTPNTKPNIAATATGAGLGTVIAAAWQGHWLVAVIAFAAMALALFLWIKWRK